MRTIRDDVRMAIRRLRQQPGFTAVAVATLALGLGANITIFTLVHTLMRRSLPVERPHELYRLGDNDNCCRNSGLQGDFSLFSLPLFEHLRANTPQFAELAAFQATTILLGLRREGETAADSFPVQFVSGNYFRMFGVHPAAGRLFTPDDDRPGATPVIVLSHRVWAREYGADPALVGGTVIIAGQPMTVAGVAAEGFFGDTIRADPAAFWLPIALEPVVRGVGAARDGQHWLYAIGRIRPDAEIAAISAAATSALQSWLAAQPFTTDREREELPRQRIPVVRAGGGVALMRVSFGQSLLVLTITSALVLLIACANLANLLLARADRGQAAIRAALGASSRRLLSQSMIEGVVLALAGAIAGFLVAIAGARALVALAFPTALFVPVDATPSLPTVLFGLLLAIVTGALFSAAPAWAMSRAHPLDALQGIGRSGHERSFVPRRSLVIAQVALSLVLLMGAGLLARSLGNLENQSLGFEPEGRFVVRLEIPPMDGDIARLSALYERMLARVGGIPGVESVSYALYTPMESNNYQTRVSIDGRAVDPSGAVDSIPWNRVGPAYFDTAGTRVVRGRGIEARDTPLSPRIAVVNQAFVRRYIEAGEPLGRRLGLGDVSHARDFEIVGIVEDVKYTAANRPTRPMIFLPTLQIVAYDNPAEGGAQARTTIARALLVRTAAGAPNLERDVRRALGEVDPSLIVFRVLPLSTQVSANFRMDRLMSRLMSAYGGLALALAALGLYGVTAYGVARRRREIGIRMALGAGRGRILATTIHGPLVQVGIGLAIGVPLALFGVRAIEAQLYDVGARNPAVLGIAILILLSSAVAAAIVPALRATAVDPTEALR
jgi:predicted permease